MREFLSGLFEVSLTMGAVTALLLILSPVWKRRFRPQWRCWAWLLVALRLAVPFNVSLPRAPVVLEAPAPAAVSAAWVEEGGFQGVELTARTLPPGEAAPEAVGRGLSLTTAELAFAVWAAVAAGVLAGRLLRYAAFRRRTARWCTPAGAYEGVPVYACALLSSPALTGLLRPRILLPEGVEEERRAFALAHEAMHARRRDLWRKALLLWVCALHWFNPLVHWMAAAASRDLERSCDEAAVAGRDAAFRAAYGAALLDAVEEGIEARAPLTTHFRGGKTAMKERLLSIASGGTRKKGVALVCAAALVISAGAAACSLGTAGEPRQLNGILDRENYALRGVGEYVAAFDAAGGFIVDLGDPTEPGEARPPAWGMIVSRYDPKWSVREDRLPDFAALVTTYGMEMFDDDGNPVLPAEAVAVTVEDLSCKIEDLEPDADVPLWTYKVLVERADGREELHTFYLMNQADPNNGIYDLWFDLSQVSREEAEAVRNTLVLGYDRTDSPDGTRLLSIQPWGGDCMLYDISGEYPVALGQVSCSSGMSGGAVHSDPLWSPDGSRVAVTSTGRIIDAGMSFSFPIGPLPPELTHQKEGGLAGLTFAALNPEYQMGDAVGYPRCVPLAWSEDGLSLQYSWAWADTEGQLHEGTAWYCFDENGRFTEIRDVVENDVYPVHG